MRVRRIAERRSFLIPINHQTKEGPSDGDAVFDLAEVGSAGIMVHCGIDFPDSRQGVHNDGSGLHVSKQGQIEDNPLLGLLILIEISKAFFLNPSNVKDIAGTNDIVNVGSLINLEPFLE